MSVEMEVFHVVMVVSIAAIAYIVGRMDGDLSATKRVTKAWEDSLVSTVKSYEDGKAGIAKGYPAWESGQFADVDYPKCDKKGRLEDGKDGPK